MRVAFFASEAVPFAKTGGLADVAGSLPGFLKSSGVDVRFFMPFYLEVKEKRLDLKKVVDSQSMDWQGKREAFSLWEHTGGGFPAYFVEKERYFNREHLYGTPKGDYPDNGERFAFFSKASLESLKKMKFAPDVFHCHDWQSALTLAYLKFTEKDHPLFEASSSLFTIHNIAYQGLFERGILEKVGLPDVLFNIEGLEYYGKVSFLKAGILYSTALNTVSPRYSKEIQTPGFGYGLDGLLRTRSEDLYGILNGVDYTEWSPEEDAYLKRNYSADDLNGKLECKRDLLEAFGLPSSRLDIPVVGMVSRLAGQKGLDILCEALEEVFRMNLFLVILGTGEAKIHDILKSAKRKYPSALGLRLAFDNPLAHKILAGSDCFLIPSRYEPCGLTQMYSLKYGSVPVVRATGGLDDTVQEFDPGDRSGNGFKFTAYSPEALVGALEKALGFFRQPEHWAALIRNAMSCDFSWNRSSREYLKLYQKISAA